MKTIQNNTFSWSRFALAYRNEFVENWKAWLFTTITVLGILTFLFIWLNYMFLNNMDKIVQNGGNIRYNEIPYMELPVMMITSCFLSTLVGSFTFRKLRTKQGRIADITLPVSQFEKYMVRWVNVVVLYNVALVVVYTLADIMRCVSLKLIFPEIDGIVIFPLFKAFEVAGASLQVLFFVSFYFLNQAIYMEGSAFMPNYSFIKTYVVAQVVAIIFLIVVTSIVDETPRIGDFYPYYGVVIAMTVVCWVIAYYRYKKTQVVRDLF